MHIVRRQNTLTEQSFLTVCIDNGGTIVQWKFPFHYGHWDKDFWRVVVSTNLMNEK